MKNEIEKLIPKAISAIEALLLNDKGKVLKEYDGYAASLGAAIRTSGLIPALAFYTDISRSEGSARRYRLLQAVALCLGYAVDKDNTLQRQMILDQVISDVYGHEVLQPEQFVDRNSGRTSLKARELGKANLTALRKWTNDITNASIALKLAMRNFPHSDDKTADHES